jgi:restriction endonuclease S subunit
MSEFKLSDDIDKEKIFFVKISQLTTQWSPTFYHKERLKYLNIFLNANYKFNIKKLKRIINISSIKSIASNVDRYIGMANIESNTGKYIASENDKGKGDCSVFSKGSVLFGKLRPYLNKVYLAGFNGGCTTEFIVMNSLDENIISNKFLSIFLLLDCVVCQTKYMMTGNTLPRLQTFDIENLIIPIPPKSIQQDIINIMDNTYFQEKEKEEEAKKLLDSIDNYLLDELGIILPKINNSLEKRIFEINLSEISGNRFDCDYYSAKYEILKDAILKAKTKDIKIDEIDSVTSIIKGGKTPASHEYSDIKTSFPIVKAGSYTDEYINLNKLSYTKEENNFEVQKGDIFILSAAHQSHYVGRQIKFLNEYIDTKISYVGELICIRTIEELCIPMFLFSLLNLEIYKTLLNREKTGQTSHIYGKDIKKIKIPLPPIKKQNEIATHIIKIRAKAKKLKTEALQDLENAKLEVEKMILGE